jgi:hypothetical protein
VIIKPKEEVINITNITTHTIVINVKTCVITCIANTTSVTKATMMELFNTTIIMPKKVAYMTPSMTKNFNHICISV